MTSWGGRYGIEVWAIPHFGNGFKYSRRFGVEQTSENAVRLRFIPQDRQAKQPSICNINCSYLLTYAGAISHLLWWERDASHCPGVSTLWDEGSEPILASYVLLPSHYHKHLFGLKLCSSCALLANTSCSLNISFVRNSMSALLRTGLHSSQSSIWPRVPILGRGTGAILNKLARRPISLTKSVFLGRRNDVFESRDHGSLSKEKRGSFPPS